MRNPLKMISWSPYKVGISIGILSWITFLFMLKMPASTTAFVRIAGFIVSIFSTQHISDTPYFAKYLEYKPVFEWQVALVLGIFVSAWISAKLSGVTFSDIPYLWGQNFGFSKKIRSIGAFAGGFLLLFGARLAGGCTLGHAISGGLQLATYSWLFLCSFFICGVITAHILYRNK